jgi:hypothetical protein
VSTWRSADSDGHRNSTSPDDFDRGLELYCLAGPVVQFRGDGIEVFLAEPSQLGALREILPKQPLVVMPDCQGDLGSQKKTRSPCRCGSSPSSATRLPDPR